MPRPLPVLGEDFSFIRFVTAIKPLIRGFWSFCILKTLDFVFAGILSQIEGFTLGTTRLGMLFGGTYLSIRVAMISMSSRSDSMFRLSVSSSFASGPKGACV